MKVEVKPKLIRITTVPVSLKTLLKGQHRFMQQNGLEVIGMASPGQKLEEVHKGEGIRVVPLEMTRTISPLRDIKSLWQFYRLCKKEKPQIVHSHTPKAGIVAMLGAKLAGVPFRLHTVAGMPLMEATGLKRKVLDWVEKLTYASATKVYPNSVGLYDFILQHNYTNPSKVKVLGNGSSNGIDTTCFSKEQISVQQQQALKKELGIGENDFVFIFVGRLVGDKGINELVAAFRELETRDKIPGTRERRLDNRAQGKEIRDQKLVSSPQSLVSNIKLLLVGPLETELDPLQQETLKEIETNPSIIAVGFQSDVLPYFAISDALVFPSYREGFPNVVMQAGAMGLPAIVSDINGCNEIIVEGQNGIIIPAKNSNSLLVAMDKIMKDSQFYSQLQMNARQMIVSRYEQKVVWEAILEEYRELKIRD